MPQWDDCKFDASSQCSWSPKGLSMVPTISHHYTFVSNCTDTPGHDDYFVSGDDNYYPPSNEGGGGKDGGGKGDGKGGKSSKYCKKAKKGHKGGKGSKGGHHYYECEDDDTLPGYDDYWVPTDGKWKEKSFLVLNSAFSHLV